MLTKIKSRKYRRALQPLESHQAFGIAQFLVCLSPGLCPDFFVGQLRLLLQTPTVPLLDLVLGICFSRCSYYLAFCCRVHHQLNFSLFHSRNFESV